MRLATPRREEDSNLWFVNCLLIRLTHPVSLSQENLVSRSPLQVHKFGSEPKYRVYLGQLLITHLQLTQTLGTAKTAPLPAVSLTKPMTCKKKPDTAQVIKTTSTSYGLIKAGKFVYFLKHKDQWPRVLNLSPSMKTRTIWHSLTRMSIPAEEM